uniref:Transmembrane 9 superfamily member n=1 Tax=Vitis vinifera TaxID=29760 RepID=A5C3A6_VITVI|nr:hypothetical protein VITISV_002583 [Vitis vinifera]
MTRVGEDSETVLKIMEREQAVREKRGCYLRDKVAWERRKAGIVFVIFLRTVRRDFTRYEELDKEAQAQMNEELSRWKLVVGDVFREPDCLKLLYVMIL